MTLPAFAPALHGAMAAILLAIAWAPQAQAWSPSDLPNLALWLDASTATSNAGTVSISNAGSGGGTISGPASLVANGIGNLQAAQFNGTSQYLTGNYTNTGTTLTAFFVGKSAVAQQPQAYAGMMSVWANDQVYDYNNAGSAVIMCQNNTTANSILSVRNSAVLSSKNGTLTTAFLAGSVFSGSQNTQYLNGYPAVGVASSGSFNAGKVVLGSRWNGSAFNIWWNGTFGEAIICNANLSIEDRQKTEGYLAWKWGTQASLPADHPYKNAPYAANLTVTVTAPANGQQFATGSSVSAESTAAGGTAAYTVTYYKRYNAGAYGLAGTAGVAPYTVNLGTLADGTYDLYATVTDSATPTAGTATSTTNTFIVAPDTTAPTPDPMTFAVAPASASLTSITMTATTASAALTPPVEYFFTNMVDGSTSGWISSTVWTNTGLTAGTTYGYRVKARDSSTTPNETAFSAVSSVYITANATITWDVNGTGDGQTDGAGTWLAASQWWDGFGNPSWNNSLPNNAVIGNGGAGGTITLGTVTAGSVTFTNFTGTYTLSGGSLTVTGGVTVASGDVTISTPIGGAGGVSKGGSGTLTLSSAGSTFSGSITVNGGTLKGTVAGAFGASTGTRTFYVNSGGTLDFGASAMLSSAFSVNNNLVIGGGTVINSGSQTANGLNNVTLNGGTLSSTTGETGPDTWGAWIINGKVTATGTSSIAGVTAGAIRLKSAAITPSPANTDFDVQSGILTVSVILKNGRHGTYPEHASSLTKLGGGVLILSGTNTYTGATTVSGGTLVGVAGGSCASSAVTVTNTPDSLAALGVFVTDSARQWTCSSLTFNTNGEGAQLQFRFAVTPSLSEAPLKVTGDVTFNGTPLVVVDPANLSMNKTYPLMVVGGTAPSTVPTVSIAGMKGILAWEGNTLYLTIPPAGTLISFF